MGNYNIQWSQWIPMVSHVFSVQDGLQLLVRGFPTDPAWNLLQGPRRGSDFAFEFREFASDNLPSGKLT